MVVKDMEDVLEKVVEEVEEEVCIRCGGGKVARRGGKAGDKEGSLREAASSPATPASSRPRRPWRATSTVPKRWEARGGRSCIAPTCPAAAGVARARAL